MEVVKDNSGIIFDKSKHAVNSAEKKPIPKQEIIPAHVKPRPFINMTLVLTDRCNLKCTYCYECNYTNIDKKVMSWDVAKRALDMFYSQIDDSINYTSLSLFGGEPHLAIDIIKKVVDYSSKHRTISEYKGDRFNYSVNTNGTILSKDIFEVYSMLGKKINVRLSIDGYEKNHDLTRRTVDGHGSWSMLEKNLKGFMKLRDDFGVQLTAVCTINKSNYKDLYYNLTKLYELTGISYLATLFVHEADWNDEELDAIIEQVSMLYDYGMNNKMVFPICRIGPVNNDPVHICSSGLSSYLVDYKGDIYPCHRCYFYNIGSFYKMGNIYKGIDMSKRMMMYEVNNMKNMPPKCNQCLPTIKAKCHICFATNTTAYNDPYTISHKYCMFQKQLHYMLLNKWSENRKASINDGSR